MSEEMIKWIFQVAQSCNHSNVHNNTFMKYYIIARFVIAIGVG